MSQYVGKLISLIDTKNIRYGGVLASISAETSTLVLKDVTVFGTESRATGADSVPKEPSPRSQIEFKGSDVQDLQVLESDAKPDSTTAKTDKDRGSETQPQTKSNADIENENFFERTQRLASSKEKETPAAETSAAYDSSSSFFDTLGTDSFSTPGGWAQERSVNMETFGESGQNYRFGGRGRGRGRGGRGGRGFHRGGNRPSRGRGGGPRNTGDNAGNAGNAGDNGTQNNYHHSGEGSSSQRGGRGRGRGRGKPSGYSEFTPGGNFS